MAKGGRPTKYISEFAAQASKLCALGATDVDLADFFRVSIRTIAYWKRLHPEFLQALKVGKDEADARVEDSLYQRATGYTFDSVKIFMPAGAKKPVIVPFREHVPPDTTAMIFWLKNRRPEAWRDRHEVSHNLSESFLRLLEHVDTGLAARVDSEPGQPDLIRH